MILCKEDYNFRHVYGYVEVYDVIEVGLVRVTSTLLHPLTLMVWASELIFQLSLESVMLTKRNSYIL